MNNMLKQVASAIQQSDDDTDWDYEKMASAAITAMGKPETFSQEEIERWINELSKECSASSWHQVYKEGWQNALMAVLCKIDEARKVTPA